MPLRLRTTIKWRLAGSTRLLTNCQLSGCNLFLHKQAYIITMMVYNWALKTSSEHSSKQTLDTAQTSRKKRILDPEAGEITDKFGKWSKRESLIKSRSTIACVCHRIILRSSTGYCRPCAKPTHTHTYIHQHHKPPTHVSYTYITTSY